MKRLILIIVVIISIPISSQTIYYSQTSGDPAVLSNWNTNRAGGGTSPSNFTTNDQQYIIQNSHTMTTTSSGWSVSGGSGVKVEIENGGILQSDYPVTFTSTPTFQIDDGGTYKHNNTSSYAATVLKGVESFSSNSTVEINSTNTTGPSAIFGNLTINLTTDPGGVIQCSGSITTVNGNLSVLNTQNREFRLSATTPYNLTIAGDLIIEGGILEVASSAGSSVERIIIIGGNYDQVGGIFQCTGSSNSVSINFTGSGKTYIQSGGTITTTNMNFAVAADASLTLNNNLSVASSRSLSVASTLVCGTNVISGAGSFSLASGATLKSGHTSGLNGNITTTGTSYDPAANFDFNGSSAQVTGDAFTSANNLTINNSSGVSLSTNAQVTGTLTLTSGLFTLGTSSLSLGNSATVSGSPSSSNMIVATGSGYLTKGYSGTGSFTFPIGDNTGTAEYSPATLNFTSGSFASATASVNLADSKHSNNTSSTNYLTRYWTVASSGISSFSCDVTFTYVDVDVNGTESSIYLGKYSSGTWTLLNAATTASNQLTGTVSNFSDFTGGESAALPVELTSFFANTVSNTVQLNWQTATEVNNYGFEIQRSAVGGQQSEWISLGFVRGNGNCNSPKNYSFTDQPTGGKEFKYRLKQIDIDGSFEYSFEITAKLGNVSAYKLDQNYPNPFNPYTKISYTVPQRAYVHLRVYDMLAKEVVELVNTMQESGRYEVTFDGTNLPSGAYFYKLEAGNYVEVKKLLLIK